ncbi:MAG: tRNA dimethylallyltransferase [Candidatus Campbellbacteria bacterium GW2011_GWD1_35_49]|nr:MAG: tRNA dimethylallyltransferase [Candidatus Campbellbacteria bacterium GW2011_GWD2_35_24]KKP75945.1 MAG: tRNA delta(2)-isopentenylpyrophosphate transferase, tRNA dimethylallyltransferase [Candidatus Campbellbacteria bacterium GW2011_GWC2_35_28]KKP76807.1 MAG: tRNA dimethylallyltransferase [Candidatus Campbellbacteria bacterium GW2011_GWC1_35_31]KKP78733.1 MAG: tRNA dimethylallyltransferase [Candidatus Campbellbacteria bacterium GW2011_GWD1_35_49]
MAVFNCGIIINMKKGKIIVVLGPTSSGKSDLAVELAKKFNGEIISADSRQVYKGLDIGSGKITKKEMQKIPHYLLDVVSPKSVFTIAQFKKNTDKIIRDILKKGKTPIIAGGTGFYIQSIVDNIVLPEVKPNLKLRKELAKKSVDELANILKKMDKNRAGEIDLKNPRRLIRAIEIATELGKVPKLSTNSNPVAVGGEYDVLQIGIKTDDDILKERIAKRFEKRVKAGIVKEAEDLHKNGLSWKRMKEIGLAHKYISLHLQGKMTKDEMIENSIREEWQYAKRQKTWFKRDKRIEWFGLEEKNKIFAKTKKFLK